MLTPERVWLLALCDDARLPELDSAELSALSASLNTIDALHHGPPPPDPRALRAREDLPLARPCLHDAPAVENGWLLCRGPTLRSSG